MENRVSTTDARRTFSELLKGVQMGRRYLITSNGRAIARLIPPGTDERWREAARARLLTRLRAQRALRSTKMRWTRDDLYEK
jgi:prevent-host-death family protein